jgi:hypothetical protein
LYGKPPQRTRRLCFDLGQVVILLLFLQGLSATGAQQGSSEFSEAGDKYFIDLQFIKLNVNCL